MACPGFNGISSVASLPLTRRKVKDTYIFGNSIQPIETRIVSRDPLLLFLLFPPWRVFAKNTRGVGVFLLID